MIEVSIYHQNGRLNLFSRGLLVWDYTCCLVVTDHFYEDKNNIAFVK